MGQRGEEFAGLREGGHEGIKGAAGGGLSFQAKRAACAKAQGGAGGNSRASSEGQRGKEEAGVAGSSPGTRGRVEVAVQ